MTLDDVAAIARNAVDVYRSALDSGVPGDQAAQAALAHTVMHWPVTDDGQTRTPPRCTTSGCDNLALAVLSDDEPKMTAVCINCMLDQTKQDPTIEAMSIIGRRIDLSDNH